MVFFLNQWPYCCEIFPGTQSCLWVSFNLLAWPWYEKKTLYGCPGRGSISILLLDVAPNSGQIDQTFWKEFCNPCQPCDLPSM